VKAMRALSVAAGFVGGLLVGATSQAVRLAIAEKQTLPSRQGPPEEIPAFLKPDPEDDTPSTGSTSGDA